MHQTTSKCMRYIPILGCKSKTLSFVIEDAWVRIKGKGVRKSHQ
jgi:hypothetical protein